MNTPAPGLNFPGDRPGDRRRFDFPVDDVLDITDDGLALILRWEAFRASWYLCAAGVWTIGYGTTEGSMRGVSRRELPGPIDEPTARRLAARALARIYEPGVEGAVRVPLTPDEFSALVSLVYNIGKEAFRRSSLLRLLNGGDYAGAASQFDRWVYAKGRRLLGLERRRAAERALFERRPEESRRITADSAGIEPLDPLPVVPLPAPDARPKDLYGL